MNTAYVLSVQYKSIKKLYCINRYQFFWGFFLKNFNTILYFFFKLKYFFYKTILNNSILFGFGIKKFNSAGYVYRHNIINSGKLLIKSKKNYKINI